MQKCLCSTPRADLDSFDFEGGTIEVHDLIVFNFTLVFLYQDLGVPCLPVRCACPNNVAYCIILCCCVLLPTTTFDIFKGH